MTWRDGGHWYRISPIYSLTAYCGRPNKRISAVVREGDYMYQCHLLFTISTKTDHRVKWTIICSRIVFIIIIIYLLLLLSSASYCQENNQRNEEQTEILSVIPAKKTVKEILDETSGSHVRHPYRCLPGTGNDELMIGRMQLCCGRWNIRGKKSTVLRLFLRSMPLNEMNSFVIYMKFGLETCMHDCSS